MDDDDLERDVLRGEGVDRPRELRHLADGEDDDRELRAVPARAARTVQTTSGIGSYSRPSGSGLTSRPEASVR